MTKFSLTEMATLVLKFYRAEDRKKVKWYIDIAADK